MSKFNSETAKDAGKKSRRTGIKNERTILREKLGIFELDDLKEEALNNFQEALNSDKNLSTGMPIRLAVSKDVLKIITPQKRELQAEVKGNIGLNITVNKFFD